MRYVEGLNDARTPLADFFSILLVVGFGALDRGDLGQYQGSSRIGWAEWWNNVGALLLVHECFGGPTYFLGEIGYRFAERDVAIPIGVGFATQGPQQIVGEQAMPMPVVFQPLPDSAGSDDMETSSLL